MEQQHLGKVEEQLESWESTWLQLTTTLLMTLSKAIKVAEKVDTLH